MERPGSLPGTRQAAGPAGRPASVLIVKLSSLGDVVHAMPVVHDLRAAFPGVVVDWVAEPAFAPLVARVDGVRRVIPCALRRWRKRWWTAPVRAEWRAFLAALRVEHYDAVLDLQGLTKSALIARLAHGRSHGLANRTDGASHEPPARWLVHHAIRIPPRTHAVDRSRALAGRALGYTPNGAPVFGLVAGTMGTPAASEPVACLVSALPTCGMAVDRSNAPRVATAATTVAGGRPVVVFVHGTSRDDKLWPDAHWLALGRRCAAAGWQIALPQSGAVEAERAQRWAAAWAAEGVPCTVWPPCDLGTIVDRLAAVQGVVGVDSGLSHIAVALDLPHVQIYNLPTAWRTGPQADDAVQSGPGPTASAMAKHESPTTGLPARPRQVSVEVSAASAASAPPGVDAVWAAWNTVSA